MSTVDSSIELNTIKDRSTKDGIDSRSITSSQHASTTANTPTNGSTQLGLVGGGALEDDAARMNRLSMMSEGESMGKELEPVDRGRGAWQFVFAATILETFIWGFGICFSVVLVYLENNDPWRNSSLSALSSIGTVQLGLMYFLTFFVNNAFRRYPDKAKLSLYISAIVYSGSMIVSSFATQVWQLIVLQGILCGLSGAVLYGPVLLWVNDWFYQRRGLGSGIIFSGTGLGGFAFPFLIGKLLDKYGFSNFCRIWGGICGATFLGSVYMIRPRIPPLRPNGPRPKWILVDFKTFSNPMFWTMSVTTFIASLAYFPVSLYLPIYTTSLLHSTSSFTPNLVVAIFNLVSFFASMAIGYCSDYSLAGTATSLGIIGGVVSLAAWGTANSLTKIFLFSAFFSLSTPISSYWGSAARHIAGADPYLSATVSCVWGSLRGTASIIAPFISTSLYSEEDANTSSSGSWGRFGFRDIIIFVGVMSFVSSFGGVALGFFKVKSNQTKQRGPGGP